MKIKVEIQEVYQSAMYLKQKAETYDQMIIQMNQMMHQMQSVWQGKDNEAFIAKVEAFQPQLKRMTSIIEQYSAFIRSSAMQYEQLQQERAMAAERLA